MNRNYKKLIFPFIIFSVIVSCDSNNNKYKTATTESTDSAKSTLPYHFAVPQGWTTEQIIFPVDFAPQINYTGMEDLRFAKGWEDITSEEHWCYGFLWWLEGKPPIDAAVLQDNLTAYYSGLIKRNVISRTIPAMKVVPTAATIKKAATMQADAATYSGTISMLDYIAQTPIILNCMIHVKNCEAKNHTAIIFQISPRPYGHALWNQLNKLNDGFKCSD